MAAGSVQPWAVPNLTEDAARTSLRIARLVALALAASGVLTGCLRIDADLTLHSNDTVSGTYLYAVSETKANELGVSGEDLASQLGAGELIDTFAAATTAPYTDGDLSGVTVAFTNEPLATFDGTTLSDGLAVVRDGGDFVVTGPTLGDLSPEDTATLGDAHITLSVTFPGKVEDHNGTLDGHTVTWDLTTATEPPFARGSARDPLPLWVGFAGSALAAAAVAGAAYGWVRWRRGRTTVAPSKP